MSAVELGAIVIETAIERAGISKTDVNEVINSRPLRQEYKTRWQGLVPPANILILRNCDARK